MPPPWSALHARLHHTLHQRQLLPPSSRVLVAVSGGQDSLALVQLLLDLRRKWQWTLAIAHCDHRWRPDSARNAAHVSRLAQEWKLPCHLRTASVEAAMTSEAAARDWRYRELATVACEQGYPYLVTGHTASDRAETLLYNLVRGSGADGLQALTWRRELKVEPAASLWLVRPLLDMLRQETAQVCATYQLPVWDDETNRELRYARNRVRHELLPYLAASFNPSVERTLAQTAEVLQADVAYLEAQVDLLWTQAVRESDTQGIAVALQRYSLHRLALQMAPLALQRRLLRRLFRQASIAPSFKLIEALLGLIDGPNGSQTSPLHRSAIGRVEGDWIVFRRLPAGEKDHRPSG